MSPWLSAAAVSSFTDGVGTGQWTDAGNWSNDTIPADNATVLISSDKNAEIYGTTISATTVNIGNGVSSYTPTATGTGSLLITNGALITSSHMFMASTSATTDPSGVSSLTLSNGSYLEVGGTFGAGCGWKSDEAGDDLQKASVYIDGTSSGSFVLFNLGRNNTEATMTLAAGAQVTAQRLAVGVTSSTETRGIGHLYMYTGSSLITSRSLSVGIDSSLNLDGGSIQILGDNGTINQGIIVQTNSTLIVNGGTISSLTPATGNGAFSVSGAQLISFTNGTLSWANGMTIDATTFTLDHSTASIGGSFFSTNSGTTVTNGSSLTVGALEAHFAATEVTISGTSTLLVTSSLSSELSRTAYTGWLYVEGGSSMNIGTNGAVGIGKFMVGQTGNGAVTMTDGEVLIGNYLTLGSEGGVGSFNMSGGTIMSTQEKTRLDIGQGASGQNGIGVFTISGTATAYIPQVTIGAGSTFSGNMRVEGVQETPTLAEGSLTAATLTMGSGAVLDGMLTVAGGNGLTINVAGASSAWKSAYIEGMETEGTITISLDLSDLVPEGSVDLNILTVGSLASTDNVDVSVSGLADGYQADWSWVSNLSDKTLVLSVSAIPEPAVSCLILAAAAMMLVARRRK